MSLASRVAALAQRIGEVLAEEPKTYRFQATVSPTTAWKNVTFDLPVPLNADKGLQGSILADAAVSTSSMIVSSLARHTGTITTVTFRVASLPANFGANTSVIFVVEGYPA